MSKAMGDARVLHRISFVTGFGDYLTYFSVVKIVYAIHGDVLAAAFGGVGVGSFASICAGVLVPYLKRHFNTKTLIVLSQVWSGLVVVVLLWLTKSSALNAAPFFVVLFLQTFLSKMYDAAKETHTHALSEGVDHHASIQATLLGGLYKAQFLGPISAFVLLKFFSTDVPVLIDLATFFISSCLALQLNRGTVLSEKLSVLRAVGYLRDSYPLRKLFILRTFGFWIPASFFNVIIYEHAVKRFGLGVEYSAVIYSLLGFGALAGTMFIQRGAPAMLRFLQSTPVNRVAAVAQVGFFVSMMSMFISSSVWWGTLCYLVYGVFMGLNAVATQSMRRMLCSKDQMPEIIGLEALASFSIQFMLVSTISVTMSGIPYSTQVTLTFWTAGV